MNVGLSSVLRRPIETARHFGKFDGSGVSGSAGRGRSQALESKVRFADHPGTPQSYLFLLLNK